MTSAQRALIRSSYASILARLNEVEELFFATLPVSNRADYARLLISLLHTCVSNLDSLEQLQPAVVQNGLVRLLAQAYRAESIKAALADAFSTILGAEYSAEVSSAWQTFCQIVVDCGQAPVGATTWCSSDRLESLDPRADI